MPAGLSGPGIGLPPAQNLYPSQLNNAPSDPSSNQIGLAPGDTFVVPAGEWYIGLGMYLVLQFLDPTNNTWYTSPGSALNRGMTFISSDGFTVRIANLTGCVVSASVINGGTNYVQATTTLTVIGAGFNGAVPTMVPIVGGALGPVAYTLTSANAGGGYGVAPIILIPPPPPAQSNANGVGGIAAQAIAIISSGTISSVSMINPGAGYPSAPTAVVVPSPFDPNLSTGITQATVSLSLTSSGVIMGALVTNNGSPLANGSLASVTISVGGAGSSGSLTANVMQTVVSGSVSGTGTGFGTAIDILSYGGVPVAGTVTNNPFNEGIAWLPRQAQISAPSVTAGAVATIYDGGLFEAAPTFLAVGTLGGSVAPTLSFVMGGRFDIAVIQPTP